MFTTAILKRTNASGASSGSPTAADVTIAPPSAGPTPPLRARQRWGSHIAGGLFILVALFVIQDFLRKPAFEWRVVWKYLFDPSVLKGVELTVEITVVSMVIGLVLSVIVAEMRMSQQPVVRNAAAAFVWVFRAIPLLVLLIVIYNIGLLYPRMGFGVPFGGAKFANLNVQNLMTPFVSSVVAFSLHECAYGSEIVRASLQSVPKGQVEAAESLGMTHGKILRRIVIPQAMRMAIPPLANNAISMLKGTAVVAFIAVADLLYSVQQIYLVNYKIMPLLTVATIWYLALVTVMTYGQHRLELAFGTQASPRSQRRRSVLRAVTEAGAES